MRPERLFLLLCCAAQFACLARAQSPGMPAYERAVAAARNGAMDSARTAVQQALAMDPKLAPAYKLLGDIEQHAGSTEAALAAYRTSEELDPNNARLYISRSALRISRGMHKNAIKDCELAIELDPADPDGYYNRACALYLGGNIEGARRDAEKAVKLKPDHADALYLSGVTKGELFQEQAGLADIDAALKLKPSIPGGRMSMAVLLYEARRYEEAIERFGEVLATDTSETAHAHYYRGDCYYQLGRKEDACRDFQASAALGDRDALFIRKNYCDTDLKKIPRKPVKKRRSMIEF